MKVTIRLSAIHTKSDDDKDIRSSHTHMLLASFSDEGIYLWDRKRVASYTLTVEEIVALFPIEKVQDAVEKKLQARTQRVG